MPVSAISLSRSIVSSNDPHRFLQLLLAYEAPVETYTSQKPLIDDVHDTKDEAKQDDNKQQQATIALPSDAIVFYATVSPKSCTRAMTFVISEHMEYLSKCEALVRGSGQCGEVSNLKLKALKVPNMNHVLKDALHKSSAYNPYVDIDLDVERKIPSTWLPSVFKFFESSGIWSCIDLAIRTRGGYHILLLRDRITGCQMERLHKFKSTCTIVEDEAITSSHSLALKKSAKEKVPVVKMVPPKRTRTWFGTDTDSQVPIPGTLQGGFPVEIVPNLRDEFLTLDPTVSAT
jgi:hypothetical protein